MGVVKIPGILFPERTEARRPWSIIFGTNWGEVILRKLIDHGFRASHSRYGNFYWNFPFTERNFFRNSEKKYRSGSLLTAGYLI